MFMRIALPEAENGTVISVASTARTGAAAAA
jgi:hypothetical protein